MTDAQAPRAKFEIRRVIDDIFEVGRSHFSVIVVLTAILSLLPSVFFAWIAFKNPPEDMAGVFSGVPGEFMATGIAGLLLSLALIHIARATWQGRRLSAGEAIGATRKQFAPALGLSFLMNIGIILGTLALIVPGVFLMIMWSVALPVLALEDKGVRASLGRSIELTNFYRSPILGLTVLYVLVVTALMLAMFAITFVTQPAQPEQTNFLADVIVTPILTALLVPLSALGSVSIYRELKRIKEGGDETEIAAVFA